MHIHPEILPDVFAVYEHLTKVDGWNICFHTPPQFEAMTLYGNRMAAAPMPMSPLFRGESEFHVKCLPSLFRKEWTPLQKLERQIQLEDFRLMLQVNPEIKEMEEGGLEVNYNGLAQHYGIETNILDLTNSFLVAAFFATTTYDFLADVYRPIQHMVSQGVIYFFPSGAFMNFGFDAPIWPIGMEALRRPGEQRGFGVEMDAQHKDLNLYMGAHMFRFWHTPKASMRIWQMTQGGGILFPYDPMTEKVRNIRKYRIYSEEGLLRAYEKTEELKLSLDEARTELINNGCSFVDKLPFAYTDKEIVYINDLFRKMYPGNFDTLI